MLITQSLPGLPGLPFPFLACWLTSLTSLTCLPLTGQACCLARDTQRYRNRKGKKFVWCVMCSIITMCVRKLHKSTVKFNKTKKQISYLAHNTQSNSSIGSIGNVSNFTLKKPKPLSSGRLLYAT